MKYLIKEEDRVARQFSKLSSGQLSEQWWELLVERLEWQLDWLLSEQQLYQKVNTSSNI